MDASTSKKISWIQFICSIIIITDHSFDYLQFGDNQVTFIDKLIYFISQMLSSSFTWIAMQMFFVLSGYLMYRDWNDKRSIGDWYAKKIKGRIKSLVIPYFLWNGIWAIAFIASEVISGEYSADPQVLIYNLFKGIIFAQYNEIFWFMQILIFYVIISPLFGYAMSSKYRILYFLLCSLVATNTIPIKQFLGGFNTIQNYYNLFFYCFGALIAIRGGNFINKRSSKFQANVSLLILLIILIILRVSRGIKILEISNYWMMILCIVGTYSFWTIFDFTRNLKVYNFVKYSFINYAVHKPVQQLYNKIIAICFAPSVVSYIINLYGGCLMTLIFIYIFVQVMLKIVPKFLITLNGGRAIM